MARTTATRLKFAGKLRASYDQTNYARRRSRYAGPRQTRRRRADHADIVHGIEGAADPGIDAWFELSIYKDYDSAEELAKGALAADPGSRFARSTLAEIYAYESRWHDAACQIEAVRGRHPQNKWYRLTHADLLIEGKELGKASAVLKESQSVPGLERHVYKRLSRISYRLGNLPATLYWQEKLVSLAPNYLVYASDYLFLAWLQIRVLDDFEAALRTLDAGSGIYRRNARIRETAESLRAGRPADEEPWVSWPATGSPPMGVPPHPREPVAVESFPGITRFPVSMPLVTMHTDLTAHIDAATSSIRESGDVVAVSESVLSISQGRAIPLELVDSGPLARLLCRFVRAHSPLHSPEGMQGAVAESGAARILAAAIGGGLGKATGRRGLFYKIAGPRTALIDDVAACMPPFDHHLILGPADADEFSERAAAEIGCRVCVVDANNKTGAWLIGASSGIDPAMVESILSDNPAGNEDEQTPIVLIKGLS